MCGIYGFSKLEKGCTLSNDTIRYIINTLAIGNESRGRDSTGLAIISDSNYPFIFKKVGTVEKFLETPAIQGKLETRVNNETRTILGHTRQATTGEVNLINAQPFTYKNIIGTHNGIISNYKNIADKYKLNLQTTCDSEAIFGLLCQNDTLAEQGLLLSELEGYFSLAWYDLKFPNRIYFARDYNVLSIYKGHGFIIWSSEKEPIEQVKRIFGLNLTEVIIEEHQAITISLNGQIDRASIPHNLKSTYKRYYDQWEEVDYRKADAFEKLPCDYCYRRKGTYNYSYGIVLCKKCLKRARKYPEKFFKYDDVDVEFNQYLRGERGVY